MSASPHARVGDDALPPAEVAEFRALCEWERVSNGLAVLRGALLGRFGVAIALGLALGAGGALSSWAIVKTVAVYLIPLSILCIDIVTFYAVSEAAMVTPRSQAFHGFKAATWCFGFLMPLDVALAYFSISTQSPAAPLWIHGTMTWLPYVQIGLTLVGSLAWLRGLGELANFVGEEKAAKAHLPLMGAWLALTVAQIAWVFLGGMALGIGVSVGSLALFVITARVVRQVDVQLRERARFVPRSELNDWIEE